jgi:DMSO/TMAO reductase YedYZ molybdopterin-dependent catalytic subunit
MSIAAVGFYLVNDWWRSRARPLIQRVTSFVTPQLAFFSTSINPAFRPSISEEAFQLQIQFEEGRRIALSLAEIRRQPSLKRHRTMVCIGNPVGGASVGNALWTATPLSSLLERVVRDQSPSELKVIFYGLDGFYSSVPYPVAADPDSMIAYEMNGQPLPPKHGYPLRVLLPGRYGMKQPRWLEKIVVTTSDGSGYWEKRGWSDSALINPLSRIDSANPIGKGLWKVTGIAFCGDRAVGSVELSADGGETWKRARFTSSAQRHVWTTWEIDWRPSQDGKHILAVRVTDQDGKKQEVNFDGAFASGATGLHQVVVKV